MILKDVATQVGRTMLHKAKIEKFVAALRDALPKVEMISTSRNGDGSNLYRNRIARQVGKNCPV